MTSTLNLREILELIMLKVSQLVQAQNWSLLLKDEKSNELVFEVVVGINKELIKEIRLKPGEGIAGHVAETGRPIYLSNAQNEPRFNPQKLMPNVRFFEIGEERRDKLCNVMK